MTILTEFITNNIYDAECKVLKESYRLGKFAQPGKISAFAIPTMCFIQEVAKIAADSCRLTSMATRSVINLRIESGNVQTAVVHFCEHIRNISGIITGLFLALYDLKAAQQIFLTTEARGLKRKLTEVDAARLYGVSYAVSEFFKRHGIDYRICSGSTLGAEREKGVIPHDDDVDIMVHPDFVEQLNELFGNGTFKRETGMNTVWQDITGGWQCFHPDSKKGEGKLEHVGQPFVDVFCTVFDGEKIVFQLDLQRQIATEDYYSKEEWGVGKEYSFGPILLKGVENPLAYISRCYGRDSLDFASQTLHHEDLAERYEHLLDFRGHMSVIKKYGLPRRAYLADRSPITYDEKAFTDCMTFIHEKLSATQPLG